jgi:hypothetical protein
MTFDQSDLNPKKRSHFDIAHGKKTNDDHHGEVDPGNLRLLIPRDHLHDHLGLCRAVQLERSPHLINFIFHEEEEQ